MITRWPHLLVCALFTGTLPLAAHGPGSSASEPITAVIDVTQTGEPIDPMMWGRFIENLSSYLEGGLWAELIGDRKFFYPVSNAFSVAVVNQSDTERYLTLDVSNATLPDRGRQWTITGPEIDALNAAGEPQVIHTTESGDLGFGWRAGRRPPQLEHVPLRAPVSVLWNPYREEP